MGSGAEQLGEARWSHVRVAVLTVTAIALAVRERDLGLVLVPAVAYAAFGLGEVAVLLCHRGAPGRDQLWFSVDVALFATLVPVGFYGAWAARSR